MGTGGFEQRSEGRGAESRKRKREGIFEQEVNEGNEGNGEPRTKNVTKSQNITAQCIHRSEFTNRSELVSRSERREPQRTKRATGCRTRQQWSVAEWQLTLAAVLGSNGVSRPKGDWLCYCKAMKRSGMATGMATDTGHRELMAMSRASGN